MKNLRSFLVTAFVCALCGNGQGGEVAADQAAEIPELLRAFDMGTKTLDEVTASQDIGRRIARYYLAHSNAVTTRMKLPISRALTASHHYEMGRAVAREYVSVYSNDWRGWRILGAASGFMNDYEESFMAVTNAVRLGDDTSLVPMAFVGLKLGRTNEVREIVPQLLKQKPGPGVRTSESLDAVVALVAYAVRTDDRSCFVKALEGITADDVLLRDDLTVLTEEGCKRFGSTGLESLCERLLMRNRTNENSITK